MVEDTVRVRAILRGRVQGVWFRQSTADAVSGLGVRGWVRNCPDGAVEAVFEGSRAGVERALAYVAVGPERARVDQVETLWEPPVGEGPFSVR
jgi:acylphosphatase